MCFTEKRTDASDEGTHNTQLVFSLVCNNCVLTKVKLSIVFAMSIELSAVEKRSGDNRVTRAMSRPVFILFIYNN